MQSETTESALFFLKIFIALSISFTDLSGEVGCKTTKAEMSIFSLIVKKSTTCLQTSNLPDLSIVNFFGLKKGTSAPYFLDILAIFGQSVETKLVKLI